MGIISKIFDVNMDKTTEIILEELPAIIASVALIVGGAYLLFHDANDFGKLDHDGKFLDKLPWPFNVIREHSHHWMWGITIIGLGLVTLVTTIIKLLIKLDIISLPKIRVRKLLRWFEEWERKMQFVK